LNFLIIFLCFVRTKDLNSVVLIT